METYQIIIGGQTLNILSDGLMDKWTDCQTTGSSRIIEAVTVEKKQIRFDLKNVQAIIASPITIT